MRKTLKTGKEEGTEIRKEFIDCSRMAGVKRMEQTDLQPTDATETAAKLFRNQLKAT